jgi:hypothetical protein
VTVGVDDKAGAVVGVDAADADRGGRPLEGGVGKGQRGGGGGAGEDVGVVLAVVAHNEALDLDLIHEAVGEERTDRPIDHPHRQDFFFVGGALALAESAGELARGAGLLAVVHGEGEEVQALAGLGADDGGQDGAAAVGGHDRCVAQLGDLACLEDEGADRRSHAPRGRNRYS